MHSCLCIDEVLNRIVSHLNPPWPQVPSERELETLTAIGLACKTFYEPAMAASWERLVGLQRLMRIFPAEVAELNADVEFRPPNSSGVVATKSAWVVLREPSASEWDRFNSYAKHVRYLDLRGDHGVQRNFIDEFADYMKVNFKDAPAFPGLRLLIGELQYLNRPELLTLFLQPQLLSFFMVLGGALGHTAMSGTITSLATFTSSIQHITLQPLCVEQLPLLAPLRHLHSLRCALQAENLQAAFTQLEDIPGTLLPALKELTLRLGPPLPLCVKIIGWFSAAAPSLAELDVRCTDVDVAPDTLRLFTTALATFSHLTSCDIKIETRDKVLIPAEAVLAPLHAIGGALHALDLGSITLELKGAHVVALARACPNLAHLALGHRASRRHAHVALTALERVAEACPALASLALPLFEAPLLAPHAALAHAALRELHTGDALSSSGAREFVRLLFPSASVRPRAQTYLHIPGVASLLGPGPGKVWIRDC